MRRISLIIAIICLGILIGFLFKQPLKVSSIENTTIGQVVEIKGIVDSERKFSDGKLLIVNEISVYCECSKSYVNKVVIVEGIVEKFP